jgi:hypothetical protein
MYSRCPALALAQLDAARELLSSDRQSDDTQPADSGKVELNSRPLETAPCLSAAAQEAATAVAPLGIASLIALPAGQTTPSRDVNWVHNERARLLSAPRRPVKGSSLLGKDEQFERSASEDTPPAFGGNAPEEQPPAKKHKRAHESQAEPVALMASSLQQVMDNHDEAKASLQVDAAALSQVAAEQ